MSHSNGHGTHAVKKALADVHFEDVKQTLQEASKTVEKELGKAADSVVKTAKANPLVAAGVLVGAGALLGALLHNLLRPAPTAGEVILRALKRGAAETQNGVRAGIKTARRAIG